MFEPRGAEGPAYRLATPFVGADIDEVERCKNTVVRSVRQMIREHNIVRYSILSEGWS